MTTLFEHSYWQDNIVKDHNSLTEGALEHVLFPSVGLFLSQFCTLHESRFERSVTDIDESKILFEIIPSKTYKIICLLLIQGFETKWSVCFLSSPLDWGNTIVADKWVNQNYHFYLSLMMRFCVESNWEHPGRIRCWELMKCKPASSSYLMKLLS